MSSESARYWQHPGLPGVDLLRARFVRQRYSRHTHETYVIALIDSGMEEFDHQGTLLRAGPGQVILVNPDTVHTGHAGIPEGWTYRVLYPAVDVVAGAAAELTTGRGAPYFPQAVIDDPVSGRLLGAAHRAAEGSDQLAAPASCTGPWRRSCNGMPPIPPNGCRGAAASVPCARPGRSWTTASSIRPG